MAGYGSPYGQYPMLPDQGHGDNVAYYSMHPMNSKDHTSSSKHRSNHRRRSRSLSTRSRSRSRSRSPSHSRSQSTPSRSGKRALQLRDPSFLDAFRVLYLAPSRTKKGTSKYLAVKKRQDHIEEILKVDGLGSKRWLFYPRSSTTTSEPQTGKVAGARDNSDRRIKIDGKFFRKYKTGRTVARDAPVAKLARGELTFYKKLGFIRTD